MCYASQQIQSRNIPLYDRVPVDSRDHQHSLSHLPLHVIRPRRQSTSSSWTVKGVYKHTQNPPPPS